MTVRCPYCRHPDSRVVDSREQDEGQVIRRRRSCQDCGKRFTTVEEATLAVIKRSGVTEPFSRQKVDQRRPPGLPGPPGRRGRAGPAGADGRGQHPGHRVGRGAGTRGRPGHPRSVAGARRGRLPAVRQRLPVVQLDRGLREGDRRPARRASPSQDQQPPTPARPAGGRSTASAPPSPSGPHFGPAGTIVTNTSRGEQRDMTEVVEGGSTGELARQPAKSAGKSGDTAKHSGVRSAKATGKDRPGLSGQRAGHRAGLHHRGHPPLRRAGLGTPRRGDDQLARRLGQLRAARRGVPHQLVGERRQHRHHQVLPRRGRHQPAGMVAQAADQPGGADLPHRRRGVRLLPLGR